MRLVSNRAGAPDGYEFVARPSSWAACGHGGERRYGPVQACEGIAGRANLAMGAAVEAVAGAACPGRQRALSLDPARRRARSDDRIRRATPARRQGFTAERISARASRG